MGVAATHVATHTRYTRVAVYALPMATYSGLSPLRESCEPQEGKEVVVKCKGDTCTDSGAVPTTPRGVQPLN